MPLNSFEIAILAGVVAVICLIAGGLLIAICRMSDRIDKIRRM